MPRRVLDVKNDGSYKENVLKNKREREESIEKVNINAVEDEELRKLLIEQDRLERELFENRIKQLDQDKKGVKKANLIENPITAKLTIDPEEKRHLGEQLRKLSRHAYLKMRTEQQLDLWRRRLDDERKMFDGVELTEEERILNDLNNKIFDLANKRVIPKEDAEVYRMPDGNEDHNGNVDPKKKNSVLYKHYKEPKKDDEKRNEDYEWEETQKRKIQPTFGSLNVPKPSDKYKILIENQIDFVSKGILEGFELEELKQKRSKFL